ncbi:MFS transporter [Microbacterium sp. NPDC087665]|uniref:MFS transporter n=1 Tax=Microbacterium sp. NPDC087665 TaxID=3364194 RepID=UPI0037F50402
MAEAATASTKVGDRGGWASGFAPLTVPIFRLVWIASIVSNIGSWMQTVGAQWLLVQGDGSPLLVALVQTAAAAPVLIFAIPAGVIGEFLNRRRVLLYSQIVQLIIVMALTTLTWIGETTTAVLLASTFVLGIISAIQLPAFQALVPDIVPRSMLVDAAGLSSIGVNIARAVGPAIAGLVVAQYGVAAVFLLNAASFLVFLGVLLFWKTYTPPVVRHEPFVDATRAGTRYVMHSRIVRLILLRLAVFLIPANALWALLPTIAKNSLGLSAGGYGLLLAALGAGSIIGAFVLPWARRIAAVNGVVLASSVAYGAGLVVLVLSPTLWLTFPVLVVTGLAWIGIIATINGTIQAFLPIWVRTRGLSFYQLVLFGCTAAGSAVAGVLAAVWGPAEVVIGAGIVCAVGGLTLFAWPLPDTTGIGRGIVEVPGVDEAPRAIGEDDAAVLVLIRYSVPLDRRADFLAVMAQVQQTRLRTGARGWQVYTVVDDADIVVEAYTVGSWREHVSQHEGRTTEFDAEVIARAWAMSAVRPTATHLLAVPRSHHRQLRHPAPTTDEGEPHA